MSDKELSYNCRLELTKNDAKTSTQIGLTYSPARTTLYDKQRLPRLPQVRMDPAYRVGTVYTPHDGLKSTYKETYTVPIQDSDLSIVNSKKLRPQREYSKLGKQSKPLSFGLTEYKEEYPTKALPPCVQGISVEKQTTCPMVLTGKDERDPLPLTENFNKHLDIYLSTTRLKHRAFTLQEQRTLASKDILTSQETMDIPKGRGFGCRFPVFPGQDLDNREKKMTDKVIFSTEQKLRFIPKGMPKVPNFGSESETQAAYKKPEGVAMPHLFDRFVEFPQVIGAPTAKQTLCSPGMYTTESYAINNHTSPQKSRVLYIELQAIMDYDYGLYDNDLVNGESYYYEDEDEDDSEVSTLTLRQTYHMCLKPTVYESAKTVSHVFIWCFVFRLSKVFFTNSGLIQHLISFICGCLSLHYLFSTNVFYIISLVLITYSLLFLLCYLQYEKNRGVALILTSLSYLCICELWLVDSRNWHAIRGPQMLVVMKSVSLAFDLDIGTVKSFPHLFCYLGYILCPSSSVFGPWTSFNDYMYNYTEKWNFKLVQKVLRNLALALFFLTMSTCWSEYIIPNGSWKWFTAYRDALSFRTSHYFICYLSEVTLLLSGYSSAAHKAVTKPYMVELPRSIVNVVVYWNIPMHNWLKVYVFNISRKFGNFFAILSTYIVSSLLHGINFQLSAVLLSLGIYSYVEVMLRKKLASGFNACILAKDCKSDCSHKHKKFHPFVILTNAFLVLLTVFHLAYLGVVFESASQEEEKGYTWRHSINKWGSLNYLSPYVVLLTYIMYFLIK